MGLTTVQRDCAACDVLEVLKRWTTDNGWTDIHPDTWKPTPPPPIFGVGITTTLYTTLIYGVIA